MRAGARSDIWLSCSGAMSERDESGGGPEHDGQPDDDGGHAEGRGSLADGQAGDEHDRSEEQRGGGDHDGPLIGAGRDDAQFRCVTSGPRTDLLLSRTVHQPRPLRRDPHRQRRIVPPNLLSHREMRQTHCRLGYLTPSSISTSSAHSGTRSDWGRRTAGNSTSRGFTSLRPATVQEVRCYGGSGVDRGCRPKRAGSVVDHFGCAGRLVAPVVVAPHGPRVSSPSIRRARCDVQGEQTAPVPPSAPTAGWSAKGVVMSECRTRSGAVTRLSWSLTAAALLAGACDGGGVSNATADSNVASSTAAAESSIRAADGESGSAGSSGAGLAESSTTGSAITVTTATGPLGVYLVDHAGRTLYMFDGDITEGTSACNGGCAAAWPPLTTTGAPSAGENAAGARLSTITRADGSMQVVCGRHPLYYSASDTAPGQTNGQGSDGKWWVLGMNGEPIRIVGVPSALSSATTN